MHDANHVDVIIKNIHIAIYLHFLIAVERVKL